MFELNDHPLTAEDNRNEEAKAHLGHNVEEIGKKALLSHKIPHRYIDVRRYYCVDCKKAFKTYNWWDKGKRKPTDQTHVED